MPSVNLHKKKQTVMHIERISIYKMVLESLDIHKCRKRKLYLYLSPVKKKKNQSIVN